MYIIDGGFFKIMGYIIAGILLFAAALAFFIRSAWERRHPCITEYVICSEKVPEGLSGKKALYLSDLHNDIYGENNITLLRMMEEASPDFIFFGGDMGTAHPFGVCRFKGLEAILKAFSGKIPMYFGNGNHEDRAAKEPGRYPGFYRRLLKLLSDYGAVHLVNKSVILSEGPENAVLTGLSLSEKCYRHGRKYRLNVSAIKKSIGPKKEGFQIVLCHSPLYLHELSLWGADLVLSGHFHGGTVRLPFLGGVMTPQYQFFSKYCRGRLEENGATELVSGGLGTHSVNIRFRNRPEILLLKFERTNTDES